MDAERFQFLLDAYGGDSQRWPAEERAAMQAFLSANEEAEAWRQEAQALDLTLSAYPVASFDLADRILESVPRSGLEAFLDWLLPQKPGAWWRPAAAAALPLFLGIAIGIAEVPGTGVGGADTATTDADWTLQEQDLLTGGYGDTWYE